MTRTGFMGLAMAAAVATMGNIGLAKAAPRPMSRKEIERADPPMPDLLPAILPEVVTNAIDTMAERRRLARLPAGELAIIEAAEAKRRRRQLLNLARASASKNSAETAESDGVIAAIGRVDFDLPSRIELQSLLPNQPSNLRADLPRLA
jgi:hypothetical protein